MVHICQWMMSPPALCEPTKHESSTIRFGKPHLQNNDVNAQRQGSAGLPVVNQSSPIKRVKIKHLMSVRCDMVETKSFLIMELFSLMFLCIIHISFIPPLHRCLYLSTHIDLSSSPLSSAFVLHGPGGMCAASVCSLLLFSVCVCGGGDGEGG